MPLSPSSRNGRFFRSTFEDLVEHDLGADVLGLRLHLLHEPGALDHVGEPGVVLDIGGYG